MALTTGLFFAGIVGLAESVSCMPTLMGAGIVTVPMTGGLVPTVIVWIFQGRRDPSRGRMRRRYWPGSTRREKLPWSSVVVCAARGRHASEAPGIPAVAAPGEA